MAGAPPRSGGFRARRAAAGAFCLTARSDHTASPAKGHERLAGHAPRASGATPGAGPGARSPWDVGLPSRVQPWPARRALLILQVQGGAAPCRGFGARSPELPRRAEGTKCAGITRWSVATPPLLMFLKRSD